MSVRHLRVAGVQLECRFGKPSENRAHAYGLVRRAAAGGAELIVLPAIEFGVYLGGGYVERDGGDFYNCWALVDPHGTVLGRVHKTFTEFKSFAPGAPSSHVLETPLGTLGVGICADNQHTA